MALSNRIAIVIGIHNLGHLNYWQKVFNLIGIPMSADLHNNLLRKDGNKGLKRKYNEKKEVKAKRAKLNHEKMKEMINKQMKDAKRGATYRSGVALEDTIPSEIVKKETLLRSEGKVTCKCYGCHSNTHKTKASKECTYHGLKSKSDYRSAMDKVLCRLYPEHYGEFVL